MNTPLAPYLAGEPPLLLDAKRIAVFTDLHLEPSAYEEIYAFATSLIPLVGRCDALVILGDLFESYLGRESIVHPTFAPLHQAFEALRRSGCDIYLLRGNRDVLLNRSDGHHIGFTVADSLLCTTVPGKLLLTHGDAFCLGDLPYQRLRRMLRRTGMRPFLRALPLFVRRRLSKRLRNYSVQEVARKPLDSMMLTLPKVDEVMAQEGVQHAWIGHLHAAATHELGQNRVLEVLPAWEPGTAPRWVAEKLDVGS
ncbi:MAG: UDP-2,3-diacylglucosamine diphosphatase [Planctomycetota bacterium]